MENMKRVAELLEKVRQTSSSNAKKDILEKAKDDETLKKVLYYCMNPYMMYGISNKTIDKLKPDSMNYVKANEQDVFDFLDTLSKSNINDALRKQAKTLLESIEDEQVRDMVQKIMVKDLKIGCNVTTVNKVFGKNFIPSFEVQLAESYAKQKPGFLKDKEVWITTKLDGFRIVYDPYRNEFYSRAGQLYEGLDHLKESCHKLSVKLSEVANLSELVMLDGELVHEPVEGLNSLELYSLTSSAARKKGYHKDKEKLQFNVFDFIPVSEFQSGITRIKYKARRNHMDKVFNLWKYTGIVPVHALYSGKFDEEVLMTLLRQVEAEGGEGLMINTDGVYETKRTKKLLKVKTFHSADVLVLDVYEGEKGKEFEGTLGGVTIKFLHNGEERTCNCGSGFDKDERELFFNHPETIVGKIIEINYFEVSKDGKTGTESLRFGTYQHRIRDDKTEKDITDVAITD